MSPKQVTTESLVEQEKKRLDTGFGSLVTDEKSRLLLPNGDFNIRRRGQSFEAWFNSYHRLITMSWAAFFGVIFSSYFIVNLIFAVIYYAIGPQYLNGIDNNGMSPFWNTFFFSSQTLTTVGYGHISPVGGLTSAVSAIEALLGLMMFAIITGLLYGRFSRPNPRVLFSQHALISPYLNINGLMFRLVNEKSNQLINVSANVTLSRNEHNAAGAVIRKYYNLDLERSEVKFFATSWTIVHPITADSPLFGETPDSLAQSDSELIVAIEGTNDTYADPVHIRKSYLYDEFKWGMKFDKLLSSEGSEYIIDLQKIDDCYPVPLNP